MAGDTLSPSLMSGFDQGRHIVDLINMIRPDVFVPGNHEFDFGEAVFRARMSEARFPLLAANLRDGAGAPLPGFADHRIIEIDGVKIGVFGLTDDESARRSSPGSLVLSPSIPAARAEAAALREAGADLIVAVSHSTWQDDLRLANLGVIDVILSGHDHNLWIGYDGRTVIAETQADGVNVVAVDLEIAVEAGESRTVTWRPKFRVIDTGDVQPDAAIEARVAAYLSALDKDLDIVAGTTATPLDSRKALVRGEETAIGNFIADAILAETGADIAIVNGGSIRGDRTYPAGAKLTRKDVFRELPFGNKVVVVELTGKDVREALENAVWFAGKGDGRFGQIAGARIVARKDAVPGTKLTSIMIGGQPLDDAKLYKVAANDYLTGGKDGYVALARGKTLISAVEGKLMVTVVLEAIQKAGSIAPVVDGRLKLE
jgi:2',3'-cyclic-nucleotide 2'-phosphodiesterase (5'-nucleotidase family)